MFTNLRSRSLLTVLICSIWELTCFAQHQGDDQPSAEPFAWGDFTWVQGNNRQKDALLKGRYVTGGITMDMNYNYAFLQPKDHTTSGSTATFRSNELNLSYIEAGGEFHEPKSGARAKLMLQFGTRATGIPRNDNTPLRGQYDLYNALRYVTEGYAGIHLEKMHGINIDVGIFKSYVGLLSYNNFENWNYQPSFTSDNTPWFFTGARAQLFPTDRLKVELWVVNGWQTYGMFNEMPGLGYQIQWRPHEWLNLVSNTYVGWDTPDTPGRLRFHTDNSAVVRYVERKGAKGVSRAAFSLTGDLGFENGAGVVPFGGDSLTPEQHFISAMGYNRLWFGPERRWGWTIGGGFINNPGRYLALLPAGNGVLTQAPGDPFFGWDASTCVQYMPNDHITVGLEYVTRHTDTPYFSGPGGVTSTNGWNAPIGDPNGYVADLVKDEDRVILSLIFRF
ncbi:MAG: outer membrane beta-barrel protein [Flavobacteriales bacterium]|nr:outer membrane beta-barrel protein [Flavobacteriales bacterium]